VLFLPVTREQHVDDDTERRGEVLECVGRVFEQHRDKDAAGRIEAHHRPDQLAVAL